MSFLNMWMVLYGVGSKQMGVDYLPSMQEISLIVPLNSSCNHGFKHGFRFLLIV